MKRAPIRAAAAGAALPLGSGACSSDDRPFLDDSGELDVDALLRSAIEDGRSIAAGYITEADSFSARVEMWQTEICVGSDENAHVGEKLTLLRMDVDAFTSESPRPGAAFIAVWAGDERDIAPEAFAVRGNPTDLIREMDEGNLLEMFEDGSPDVDGLFVIDIGSVRDIQEVFDSAMRAADIDTTTTMDSCVPVPGGVLEF